MGKSRRGEREFGREKKLAHENKRLKRELARLNKLLARVDLDRYSNLKETIEKHYREDEARQGQDILDKIKQEWACNEPECGGFLEIFLYSKIGETWYYRVCSNHPTCKNRTKSQKYDPAVKGIIKKATPSSNSD